jgi:hypothetical protein
MRSEDEIRERISQFKERLNNQKHHDYLAELEDEYCKTALRELKWVLQEDNQ